MFCAKCGNQINDNIKFCPRCGASQADNIAVEKQQPQSGEQVLSQKTKSTKNKKMSNGKIAAIVILFLEIAIICGVFIFFSVYKNESEDDRVGSRYSLDKANENAELAYGAIERYISSLYHPQDYAAHGFFSGVFDPNGKGELNKQLSEVIDNGYVKILLHATDDYYDDLVYTVQWCKDESGDGIIGQYPDPIEEDAKDAVIFGKIYDPYSNSVTTSFKDNFYYEFDDDENIIITGYKGSGKNVVIPEYVSGLKVVAIDNYAFYDAGDMYNIESVTIPGSVIEIGENAFLRSELKSVKISEGVETIGEGAFSQCSSLKEVEIPDSVEMIGAGAFSDCSSLKEVEIPDSVETIGKYAFGSCYNLEYVEIPDSVEMIGAKAFEYCENLKEVEIKDGHRFMFKNIFTYSFIFFEYLFKVIAIGILVITIIIFLLVSRHKKRKKLKAKQSPSVMQIAASAATLEKVQL